MYVVTYVHCIYMNIYSLCSTGAALHVEAPHVPRLFSMLPNNPLCVFLFEEANFPPAHWHTRNVSVYINLHLFFSDTALKLFIDKK